MRILIVSSYLPYPLFSGGHVRLYNLLKELSRHNEITLVCEKRSHQTESDVEEVKKFCKALYFVNRKKQWSPEVIFQTAISAYPFLLSGHKLPRMQQILTKLLKDEKFDCVHIETFYVYQNLPQTNIPIVLVEHNIEYAVYQRFTKRAPVLIRPFLQIDVEKIKYWEEKIWKEVSAVVGVSQKEASAMRADSFVVPNGVDLASFPFKKETHTESFEQVVDRKILFMGDFKWIQNRDTALWILSEIFPLISASNKHIKLWIVGKHIPDTFKKYASSTINIDENAPEKTADIYKKADVLLAPIRVGGGTSYKILEAMASGVPVITTQLGIEGLGAIVGKHALVGETSEELSHAVLHVLREKKLFESLRRQARFLIEEKYSWIEIAKKMEEVYKYVCK